MRPIVVTLGPLATADADGISASQRHTGAFGFAINGLLSTGFSANSIATAQAVGAGGPLTLNGALVVSGVARLGNLPGKYVTITSAGNDAGITFTVNGINYGPSGLYAVSEVVSGTNTSVVSTTKLFYQVTSVVASAAAAGNVSVGVNGVWVADKARQVLFTPAGDDSSITYTITGTDWNGEPVTEIVIGAANPLTATTKYSYSSITSIVTSGTPASTGTIGTNGVANSMPILIDNWAFPQIALQVACSSANATVQQSLDSTDRVGYAGVNWINHPDATLVGVTAVVQGNYAYAPQIVQLVLNSGAGSATLTVNQSANVPF